MLQFTRLRSVIRLANFVFILFFLLSFTPDDAKADIVKLKNGRSIEGIITRQDNESIELSVGFGTVKFRLKEIESIYKSKSDEVQLIWQKWEEEKELHEQRMIEYERKLEEEKRRKDLEPKEVEFSEKKAHIVIDTLLNNKVKATLLLDTGASSILLSRDIAKKLNISTTCAETDKIKVTVADGREAEAKRIVLDSVKVQGVEAKDIEAAILLSGEVPEFSEDGLLGMSFLNKFNFQIDTKKKKIVLQKHK